MMKTLWCCWRYRMLSSWYQFIYQLVSSSFHLCRRRYRLLHSPNLMVIGLSVRLSVGAWDMASNLLALPFLWLVGLNIDWDCPMPHCIMASPHQWEFPSFLPQWQTAPLHSHNGRKMPVIRAMQGNCERFYRWWHRSEVAVMAQDSLKLGLNLSAHQRNYQWFQSPHPTSPLRKHDDIIKWKHFPRNWPFVRGIHRSPVNSRHKGQWRGALIFYLICVWINDWVNNREAGDLGRYRAHYDVIVMKGQY